MIPAPGGLLSSSADGSVQLAGTASSCGRLAASFAQDLSFQGQAVGVVDQAVEDGIGDGRVADDLVPVLDGQLAGDDGRAAIMAIVHDFQQVAALLGGEGGKAPIVEDQELDPREALQQSAIAAVAAGERQRFEQARHAMVEDRAIVAAGLVAEGTGDPTLAHSGRADDQQVVVAIDPIAGDELLEQGSVEPARCCRSTSSTTASCRRPANFSRATSRLFSRSVASRSSSSARRSSKPSASMSGWQRCSSSALAMPVRPSPVGARGWDG